MLLRDALGMARAELVALIGAGSTASTRLRATKELRDQGSKVQVTTTTQIVKPTGCARTANPCIRVGVIAGDATDQPVLQGMVH